MKSAGVGGRLVNNPIWRPVYRKYRTALRSATGTLDHGTHPLAAAQWGTMFDGVTDHCGRVFDAGATDDRAVHQGLVVLDGSIVPTSLGINPALTIAVLTLRAITLLKDDWQFKSCRSSHLMPAVTKRPIFATSTTILRPKPTQIELTEQLRGRVKLRNRYGRRVWCALQLTMTTKPAKVADLIAYQASQLRGFDIPAERIGATLQFSSLTRTLIAFPTWQTRKTLRLKQWCPGN